jgi:SAM-dependent methyltransferase
MSSPSSHPDRAISDSVSPIARAPMVGVYRFWRDMAIDLPPRPEHGCLGNPHPRARAAMQSRDPEANEPAAIAGAVDLDGKRVLEVGCGTGRLTRFVATRAREVYAFDPKPEAVAEAQASLAEDLRQRVRFAVHDAEALDLPRRRFDLALCGWSL